MGTQGSLASQSHGQGTDSEGSLLFAKNNQVYCCHQQRTLCILMTDCHLCFRVACLDNIGSRDFREAKPNKPCRAKLANMSTCTSPGEHKYVVNKKEMWIYNLRCSDPFHKLLHWNWFHIVTCYLQEVQRRALFSKNMWAVRAKRLTDLKFCDLFVLLWFIARSERYWPQ